MALVRSCEDGRRGEQRRPRAPRSHARGQPRAGGHARAATLTAGARGARSWRTCAATRAARMAARARTDSCTRARTADGCARKRADAVSRVVDVCAAPTRARARARVCAGRARARMRARGRRCAAAASAAGRGKIVGARARARAASRRLLRESPARPSRATHSICAPRASASAARGERTGGGRERRRAFGAGDQMGAARTRQRGGRVPHVGARSPDVAQGRRAAPRTCLDPGNFPGLGGSCGGSREGRGGAGGLGVLRRR